MANFWVHGGLLNFDNRKMSKSLGNFEPLIDAARAPRSARDPLAVPADRLSQADELHRRLDRRGRAVDWSKIKAAYRARWQRSATRLADAAVAFDARMEAASTTT